MSIPEMIQTVAGDDALRARLGDATTEQERLVLLNDAGVTLSEDELTQLRGLAGAAQSGRDLTEEDLRRLVGGESAYDEQMQTIGLVGADAAAIALFAL